MNFSTIDMGVAIVYLFGVMGIGIWLSFKDKQETAQDYFLASKALPWWAVGGSLIASNISAEQFIGMSGSGYVVGMAIASYELMAAITLVIVAKFFLPIFLDKGIYTMPQFLEERFDKRVRTGLAVFWVLLFVFVNITSVLYLGGLALHTIVGIPLIVGVIGLAVYAATFSIFGGLKAVVWTDVIQVVVLIFGGLLASYLVLEALGGSFMGGMEMLLTKAPEKFDMILDRSNPEYINLPGISVLIGGMWIANLYYWGNNQYIIQRALAAKSLKEAQRGTVFAAFLKILLPIIVVIPGIAAFVLKADIAKPDEAYPWVLSNYVTIGFKGLAFAALIAAIGSSLSSMVNSASTIFTLDIFRPLLSKGKPEREEYLDAHEHDSRTMAPEEEKLLVRVGKIAAAGSLLLGIIVAPLLGNLDQAFQYIQEYTGFISPGVVAIFLFGLFWKRTSANAALAVVVLSIPLSAGIKFLFPLFPFMDRMGVSFLILAAIIVALSLLENSGADKKAITHAPGLFRTDSVFNWSAVAICGILAAIYAVFW
ncbi:MAG: sodium/sugar symporter [Phaeodactylibacter sp.]|nr:sodium/sugar symporter [Phaeodactylibacter sp.]MCB9303676.1 sodium/sugar symporter [Lewinellaceae bacterium]